MKTLYTKIITLCLLVNFSLQSKPNRRELDPGPHVEVKKLLSPAETHFALGTIVYLNQDRGARAQGYYILTAQELGTFWHKCNARGELL